MKRFLRRNQKKHRYTAALLGAAAALSCVAAGVCGGCGIREDSSGVSVLVSVDTAMGTVVRQTVYTEEEEDRDVTQEILRRIRELEHELLSWRLDTSEVYSVNFSAGNEEGIPLSDSLEEILEQCLTVSRRSQGAFDPSLGAVTRLWKIDEWAGLESAEGYELPTEEEIQEALQSAGYEKLVLKEGRLYLPEGMQLDLGAVGKGVALTRVREYLEGEPQVKAAVISVGGSILTYGDKADGSAWSVAVVDPLDPSESLGYLALNGQWCVSTSGDYERYVEVDGRRYHHIIDPETGCPADSGLSGVTVLCGDGLLSDALSTACFVLGKERGADLVEAFGAEALFVDHDGEISMTDGMKAYFHFR